MICLEAASHNMQPHCVCEAKEMRSVGHFIHKQWINKQYELTPKKKKVESGMPLTILRRRFRGSLSQECAVI